MDSVVDSGGDVVGSESRAVSSDGEVAAVRAFNRFYTNVIGVVQGMYLDTPYSLTEARILFELSQGLSGEVTPVTELRRTLDIDPGYLSRVLSRFESDGLITRARADGDGRRQDIALTAAGRAAAADLDARSARQVGELLDGADRSRLLNAMRDISAQFGGSVGHAVVLRAPRPGDLGWVVHRHGAVYASEFGWNMDFELWVARIIADYLADSGNPRAAAWIAEVDGAPAGSLLVVPDAGSGGVGSGSGGSGSGGAARLRVLLVERWARGLGIGGRLVDEALRFARHAGYEKVTLSTYDTLSSARRIYEAAGFSLVSSEAEHAFGQDLTAQEWALYL